MSPITKCRAIRYLFTVLIQNEYRYDELILYFDKLKKLPFDFDFVKLIYIVFLIVYYRNFDTITNLLSFSIVGFFMISYKYLHNQNDKVQIVRRHDFKQTNQLIQLYITKRDERYQRGIKLIDRKQTNNATAKKEKTNRKNNSTHDTTQNYRLRTQSPPCDV